MDTSVRWPRSLWAAVTPSQPLAAALVGQAEVDVAVIGGGFSGLSSAFHLARQGTRVLLLEAELGRP